MSNDDGQLVDGASRRTKPGAITLGYDETTVARIAKAAGVTERAFFLHFPSKADALFDLSDEDLRALKAQILLEPLYATGKRDSHLLRKRLGDLPAALHPGLQVVTWSAGGQDLAV